MILEKYFGCECLSLDHIARMSYFPPEEGEEGEEVIEEDNVIYLTVKTRNYLNRILPPFSINPCNWPYDFGNYFRFHILRRIPIALCYIFNSSYIKDFGVLDCFDFQNKDLTKMKKFLSHLTDEEAENIILDKKDLVDCVEETIDKYIF